VEAEIKSDFPDVEVTFIECGFGTFKVFLDGKNIFWRFPLFGSFPREGEITEIIQRKTSNPQT
tara:strand:- start:541 stop:729 length:189 start_codon:yes stop_codon:yes gene_type:complete